MRPFQRFQHRFSLERWMYSVATGAVVFLFCADVLLILRLLGIRPSFVTAAAVLLLPCAGAMAAVHLHWPVNEREQARRLDALGLEERAVTMVQYREEPGRMAALQREDTQRQLERLSPQKLPLRRPHTLVILACVLLAAGIALGFGVKTAQERPAERDPLEQTLWAKALELEQRIKDAQLSEEETQRLMALLAQLTEDNELKLMEDLEKLEEALDTTLLTEGKESSLAMILLRHPLTSALGRAILNLDAKAASEALNEMELACLPWRRSLDREQTAALIDTLDRVSLEMELQTFSMQDMNLHSLLAHLSVALEESLEQDDKEAMAAIQREFALIKKLMEDLLNVGEGGQTQENAGREEEPSESQTRTEVQEITQTVITGFQTGNGAQGAGFGSGQTEQQWVSVPVFEPALDGEWDADYAPGMIDPDGALQRKLLQSEESPAIVPYDRVFGTYYAAYLEEDLDAELFNAAFAYFEGL